MRRCPRIHLWALAALVVPSRGEDEVKSMRRYQIEVLYTVHVALDTDDKLERIRALVLKAYPDAKFTEVSAADRKTYFGTYRERLLKMAGQPGTGIMQGFDDVKAQVNREVTLRSIYQFLHSQAKDDVSLNEIFERLRAKDDPKNPVCGIEPGKTLIVYRDFGRKGLAWEELHEVEDGGVKFGFGFRARVVGLGDAGLPKMGRKADSLGDEGEGRQIFRLVAVTEEPAAAPQAPPNRK